MPRPRFGPARALAVAMTNRDDKNTEKNTDETAWRRICEMVATESDPQRLSELVDQLLKELDARRQALRENEALTSTGEEI